MESVINFYTSCRTRIERMEEVKAVGKGTRMIEKTIRGIAAMIITRIARISLPFASKRNHWFRTEHQQASGSCLTTTSVSTCAWLPLVCLEPTSKSRAEVSFISSQLLTYLQANVIFNSTGDGRASDNSLVVSMEINGIVYQGVLFAQAAAAAAAAAALTPTARGRLAWKV